MNLNVFDYKLLIIPLNHENHKSLLAVTGLQNASAHQNRLITRDQLCILHLEPGNGILDPTLVNDHANSLRLLLNKLYKCHFKNANTSIVINPFTKRSMPLRKPKGKRREIWEQ